MTHSPYVLQFGVGEFHAARAHMRSLESDVNMNLPGRIRDHCTYLSLLASSLN